MKIIYFYQYFCTPKGAWSTRVYEITRKWVDLGHDVTVISSVYAKSDLRANKYIETQFHDGIKVKVINILIDNKKTKLIRVISFLKYLVSGIIFALSIKGDKFIVSSGPITIGILGLLLRLRKKDVTLEVRDIWPDTAIESGFIKNKFLIKISKYFEKLLYKKVTRIVCLSPGMKREVLERGGSNVISLPNFANIDFFKKDDNLFQNRDSNYAIYFGNLGQINNSLSLIEIAKILNSTQSAFKIKVVGDGPLSINFSHEAKINSNIEFFGLLPKSELLPLIQASCFAIIPLANNPILDTSSPNKLFEALSCGVPIIQNTNGWIKELLTNNKIGYTYNSNDYLSIANLFLNFKIEESYLASRTRCRYLAETEFNKDIISNRYLNFILS
jgi:glycosyltransferase involved in cell wall biosynthesis